VTSTHSLSLALLSLLYTSTSLCHHYLGCFLELFDHLLITTVAATTAATTVAFATAAATVTISSVLPVEPTVHMIITSRKKRPFGRSLLLDLMLYVRDEHGRVFPNLLKKVSQEPGYIVRKGA
jgi:hypothetical protein